MKHLHVNAAATFSDTLDLKTLVPDANMRRRMSTVVKMGVAVGEHCLKLAATSPDAVITATGYGCLADSEKFLRALVLNGEQQLTPTPFIQSTFNTIGSHIAMLHALDVYNMTYVNGFQSFADALLDAALLIGEGKNNILLITADELTPTLQTILRRLGVERHGGTPSQCAHAFFLSSEPNDKTLATITDVNLHNQQNTENIFTTPCPVSAADRFFQLIHSFNPGDSAEYRCMQLSAKITRR